MTTEEILLTCLLASTIVCMLLRPFVVRESAPRRVHRRKANRTSVPGTETYRLSRPMRNKGYVPEASPVGIAVSARKFPPVHRFGRKRNNEAYSNR